MASNSSDKKPNDRRAIERVLTSSAIFQRCNLSEYDEKLHNSLNRVIGQLEEIESNLETPEELLSQISDRHLELLNTRMKLLNIKPNQVLENNVVSSAQVTTTTVPSVTPHANENQGDHVDGVCDTESKGDGYVNVSVTIGPEHLAENPEMYSNFPSQFNITARGNPNDSGPVVLCNDVLQLIEDEPGLSALSIIEPDLPPEAIRNFVPNPIKHPDIFMASLMYTHGMEEYSYSITVSLRAHGRSESTSTLARAFVSYSTPCPYSFVSPRLLAKLKIKPIKMKPIPIRTLFGDTDKRISSYAILDVSSLYKPELRLKLLFYVLDVTFFKIAHVTSEMKHCAANQQVTISNELAPTAPDELDILIGPVHSKLFGFNFNLRIQLTTEHENAKAFYTHFGYFLTGKKKDKPNNLNYTTTCGGVVRY